MKNILITGAGTGFGRETAIALAKRGHNIYAAVFNHEQQQPLDDYARKNNVSLTIIKLDITNADDVAQLTVLDFDVVINNAAIGEGGALVEIPLERLRQNLETNVIGTIAVIQAVAPKMMAKKSGTIIIVTSLAGRIPMPFLSPYSMSKFALESAGAGLYEELNPFNVNVSMIEPGPYGTGFNESNTAKKHDWMTENSLYKDKIEEMEKIEKNLIFSRQKSDFQPVVEAMITASESNKPKLRYAVPKWMGLGVNLLRGFGV